MPQIEIAMPTYNCGTWIGEFMNSLLLQDFADWRIIARDDASADDTNSKLLDWQGKLGDRIVILGDSGTRNLGVIGNYTAVLTSTTAAWVMSADPDDVWLPGKISKTLRCMREAEVTLGAKTPLAICTDAEVVDAGLRPIAPSYWGWARINPDMPRSLPKIALDGIALGSTMMVNRALLDIALPIEQGSPYQDWWLTLVAAAFGRMIALHDRTILYRRHGANETAVPYGEKLPHAMLRTLRAPSDPRRRVETLLERAATQAKAFLARYRYRLEPPDIAGLEALASLLSLGPMARRIAVLRYGLWFSSPLKNLGMLAFL
jgi:glycosyltransferase involved in cell wall biosynthesis